MDENIRRAEAAVAKAAAKQTNIAQILKVSLFRDLRLSFRNLLQTLFGPGLKFGPKSSSKWRPGPGRVGSIAKKTNLTAPFAWP